MDLSGRALDKPAHGEAQPHAVRLESDEEPAGGVNSTRSAWASTASGRGAGGLLGMGEQGRAGVPEQ